MQREYKLHFHPDFNLSNEEKVKTLTLEEVRECPCCGIATTAVNSKTIKAMEFVNPEEKELQEFCDIVRPMFEQIKKNQFENQNLVMMRDSILPKLILGELDVFDLKL